MRASAVCPRGRFQQMNGAIRLHHEIAACRSLAVFLSTVSVVQLS